MSAKCQKCENSKSKLDVTRKHSYDLGKLIIKIELERCGIEDIQQFLIEEGYIINI